MAIEEKGIVNGIAEDIKSRYGTAILTADDFADYLGVSRQTVYNKICSGEYPGQHSGRSYTIPAYSVALWIFNLSKTKVVTCK